MTGLPNSVGTAPANQVGYSTNPLVGPFTALELNTALAACLWFTNLNVANGVPQLDGSGLIPSALLNYPAIAAALVASLPTSLPATSGILWNNGGSVSVS